MTIVMMFVLSSCMPSETAPRTTDSNSTTPTNNTAYADPTFPIAGIFVQEGGTQTTTQFSLPLNFTDSFLIRGSSLSQYLRTVPNTTKFCLVTKYTYTTGYNKFLILSAKAKSYTNLSAKTTEFYLQAEPANDAANQNDCLTSNLTTTIFSGASNPTGHFSLTQVCANCSSSVTSEGFRLYFSNGEAVPTLNLSSLKMSIAGTASSGGNACVETTACKARGYDCCLASQCVTDGAVRPEALTSTGFAQAQLDVASNPTRFVLYPEYYFVCSTRPEGGGSEDNTDPIDPEYDAQIRLMEMTQLFNCLNKVDGELSHCTVKFNQASANITAGIPFSSQAMGFLEDVNFSSLNPNLGIGDYANNITKIYYGGQTLYQSHSKALAAADGTFLSAGNDDLTTAQSVRIIKTLPANAPDDHLYLTFKIDGSCEKLGTSLARCSKSYTHASTDVNSVNYHDATKIYKLPSYADLSASSNIIVKISGIIVPEDSTTWSKSPATRSINFSASYPLYQNQVIDITYYVTSGVDALTKAKTAAQTAVNTMCICGTTGKCNLSPIMDANSNLTNYACIHSSDSTDTAPANQTVYVSNKNVPHRYYDTNGVAFDTNYATALAQEGTPFSYISNNILKPSNLDAHTGYTGFNEIYGSFTTSGTDAKPAKMVRVKKDTTYDFYTQSGTFSTCLTCGSDYYTSVKKIFPPNYTAMGGGYSPDNFDSSRLSTSGTYRSDDLLFGRACFVPATMIPWTHSASTTVKDQRRSRLASQHFLYANGYNRDWYGFDYGSLIGSFDGITWFSIGYQRRIKATSNKLFLAVNAYHGDQSVDSNFTVAVTETTSFATDIPDHDTETTGAECQKSHFCSTDDDCYRQVGYDYTCQSVSGLTTNWPQVDAAGTEVIGSATKTLASIVGGNNGQAKRCVYRGRGAPCQANLNAIGTTFNSSSVTGNLSCSPNNMCQSLNSGPSNRFNDRIARFANTPVAQNIATASPTQGDTVGLGARILGRPAEFYGTKTLPSAASGSLFNNNVTAVCIPGKNIASSAKTNDLNSETPVTRIESADKILGIGITMSGLQNPKYLNACPATTPTGSSLQQLNLDLGVAYINQYSITQNLSSNLLDLNALSSHNIFSSNNGSQITAIGYQKNACLRAPGASCFSDMDCGPSEFIASRVRVATLAGILNIAEEKFWEEEMICGNPEFKYTSPGNLNTATFDIKKNMCCRDFGKTFSVYTQDATSDYHWCDTTSPGNEFVKVAGVNTSINSFNRYSRVHSGFDKMTCQLPVPSDKSFALSTKASNSTNRYLQMLSQYKTLDAVNQRTCCTQNWVRSFDTTNGGGHKWTSSKLQTIDKKYFRSFNWRNTFTGDGTNANSFECTVDQYSNPTCEIKNFTVAEEKKYLKFFGSLELVGIPQAMIGSTDFITAGVDIGTGLDLPPNTPPYNTVRAVGDIGSLGAPVTEDFKDGGTKNSFSGTNYNSFKPEIKKVFSENEFNCCIPTGKPVPQGTTNDQCCTGYVANTGFSTTLRCCLPDFTDVTLYTNRLVSSEGRGLPDNAYDAETGYIKEPGQVRTLAASKAICCSGKMAYGVAIRKLPIPLANGQFVTDADALTRRFTESSGAVDNNDTVGPIGSLFDAGIRWNDHLYCIPENLDIPAE